MINMAENRDKKKIVPKTKYQRTKNILLIFFSFVCNKSQISLRKTSLVIICLFFLTFLCLPGSSYDFFDGEPLPWETEGIQGKIILVDDDFTDDSQNHKWNSIQEGINDAESGDLIFVYGGTYHEDIIINHSIDIIGEKTEKVIINGGGNPIAITITAPWVQIKGFTVSNAYTGVQGHNLTTLSDLIIHKCHQGICFIHSSYTLITNITFYSCHYGIYFNNFSNGSIVNCTMYNDDWGIFTIYSHNLVISNALAYNIENKSILIENSSRILVENCHLSQSFCGIAIRYSQYTLINNCILQSNLFGLRVYNSRWNTITSSTILENEVYGIYLLGVSHNNSVHHNNFVGNDNSIFPQQAFDKGNNYWGTVPHWNPTIWNQIIGPWIQHPYWYKIWNWPLYFFDFQGNYWSNYQGSDENRDGIGDTPHLISGGDNYDQCPLIAPIGYPVSYFTYFPLQDLSTQTLINFSDQSVPMDSVITSWHWDFGDGTTSLIQNPSHSYTNNGIYNVNLTVANKDGFTHSFSLVIPISNSPPVANFTYTRTGYSVTTSASTSQDEDGSITHYIWNWGDGNNTYGKTSQHIYSTDGTYTITLNITDNDGSTQQITKILTFIPPVASFSFTPNTPSDKDTIIFSDASYDPDGTIQNWEWTLGDGAIVNTQNLTYEYHDNGIYNITLTVIDDTSLTSTITKTLMVTNIPPMPNFTYSPPASTDNTPLDFTDTSQDLDGYIINWTWNFGDETKSYISHPSHQYTKTGTYNVTLSIKDDDNAINHITKEISILNLKPLAEFSYLPPDPSTGELITFNANTSQDVDGTISLYEWDWNNDGKYDESHTNPIATHKCDDNTLFVTLKVTDNYGAQDIITKTIKIKNRPPIVDFSYIPQNPEPTKTVTFNSQCYDKDGSITKYAWDFGDASISTLSNPQHIYSNKGIYTVKLTVWDDDNDNTSLTKTITINHLPQADFIYTPKKPIAHDIIVFNDTSFDMDGDIISSTWIFGDGNTSKGKNVDHSYSSAGKYNVTLTIHDDSGAISWVSRDLMIQNVEPIANFIYIPTSPVKLNAPITFIDISSDPDGDIVNWTWDLDDGNTAYGSEINHTYKDAGKYYPLVTIRDNQGQTTTYSEAITIIKENEEGGIPGFEFVFCILLLIGYVLMEKRNKNKKQH